MITIALFAILFIGGCQAATGSIANVSDDPLRLKIIVKTSYDTVHTEQSDSNAVEDKIYLPLDQFFGSGPGVRENLIISCHMTGHPQGTDLEIIRDDPLSAADVPNPITRCWGIKWPAPNVVMCPIKRNWHSLPTYGPWRCRAKQRNSTTNVIQKYTKKLRFIKVPSKINILLQYNNKWHGQRIYFDYLKFYLEHGGNAVIRCDAKYNENDRLSEIPFPVVYEFFIIGQEGRPDYFTVEGNTLRINDIPESLHGKDVACFVRPQNKSDIARFGIGHRYFSVIVFKIPERPRIQVSMPDGSNPSLTIRNPDVVELVRKGPAIELTCTLLNFDRELDKIDPYSNERYLDWVKCRNYNCYYNEAQSVFFPKRLDGDKVTIRVKVNRIWDTGFFMCVAVRPYINESGETDMKYNFIPVKLFAHMRPGESEYRPSDVEGLLVVSKSESGDIYFYCRFTGFPLPDLKIIRYKINNREVRLENPKWILEYDGENFDEMHSSEYGSRIIYRLPKESIGSDQANGTYVCTAENALGKAEVHDDWVPRRS